jgi:hypothetical protein
VEGSPLLNQLQRSKKADDAFKQVIAGAQEANVGHSKTSKVNRAFADVLSKAQEPRSMIGAGGHSISDTGKATFTKNKWAVKPSVSDFLADAQLITRKVLSESELNYFTRTYFGDIHTGYLGIADPRDPKDWTADRKDKFFEVHIAKYDPAHQQQVRDLDASIRERLGAAYIDAELYPQSWYFNKAGIDIRNTDAQRREMHNILQGGEQV